MAVDLLRKSATATQQGESLLRVRNYVINGNFDFWQRGTSFTTQASAAFAADRWSHLYDASGSTFTISRQAFSLGQTEVPNEPTYFYRVNVTAAGSGGTARYSRHAIEGVRNLAGKTITVSFYAKSNAANTLTLQVIQRFGTGGSPSGGVVVSATDFALTTVWQKFSVVVAMPSISGKTLGTANDDLTEIALRMPFNTTFTIDLAQVMLNEGSTAAAFQLAGGDLAGELSKCQRFYEIVPFGGHAYGPTRLGTVGTFKVSKRATIATATYISSGSQPVPGAAQTINQANVGSISLGAADGLGAFGDVGFAILVSNGSSFTSSTGAYYYGFVGWETEL